MLYHIRGPQALAEIAGKQLYATGLPAPAARDLERTENAHYATLERHVRAWATPIVLEKEAVKAGKTAEQYLADFLASKSQVTDTEVWERFRQAPLADTRPFPQVLTEIRSSLESEKKEAARSAFVNELLQRQGLRIFAPKPARYSPPPPARYYPVYSPPMRSDIAQGRVIGVPSRGSVATDATVLEIYSDFLCPFSRRFSQTMRELEAKYPDRLRVVYRHYPLPMHAGADRLAEASVCAQEQGRFWEMHDALMAWEGPADTAKLAETAQKAGADKAAFSACMNQNRYANFVKQEIALAQKSGVDSTPTFFLNGRKASGALSAAQVSELVEWFEKKAQTEYPGKVYNRSAQPAAPPRPSPAQAPIPSGPAEFPKDWLALPPSRGPADAPVTVIEFVDLNCPFCKKGAEAVDPIVQASAAPVRFLSRQFPLGMHPNAEKTSVAALCAQEQQKYWPYRDQIFGEFWGKQTPDDLKAAASKAGLDRNKFDKCLDGQETLDRVRKDMAAGSAAGVTGTPTYFINGNRIVGANPDAVKKAIEEAAAPSKK